jgi:oligopeptide/dipeptide ABC transporter ATP-binding protein
MLEIRNLTVDYMTRRGRIRAVNDVSLSIMDSEIVGLVGESGSGKSTLGYAILRLVPPPGIIKSGRILLNGVDLLGLSEDEINRIRGKDISMVLQDPMTSLDPLMRVGDQLLETIVAHENIGKEEAREKAVKLLEAVGIKADRFNDYPHQLSGGMRQRIMIAMAIALDPKLVIADEPTTALDVIVQDQIVELFKELRSKIGMSLLIISHDISLILEISDKVGVMYGGELMEFSPSDEIIREPLNPYTQELLKAVPNIELDDKTLKFIPGDPPDLLNPPMGCMFHPRCPRAMDICRKDKPPTLVVDGKHVKCWLYSEG